MRGIGSNQGVAATPASHTADSSRRRMSSSNDDGGNEELGRDRLGETGACLSCGTDHGPSVHAGVGRLMRSSWLPRFVPAESHLSGGTPTPGTTPPGTLSSAMQRVTRLISAEHLASNTSLVGCREGSGGDELGRGARVLRRGAAMLVVESIRRCRSTLPREKVCTGLCSAACDDGRRLSWLVGILGWWRAF